APAPPPRRQPPQTKSMPPAIATKPVDADGHIVEPADLWDRYLPERLRDAARAALSTQDFPDGGTSLVLEGRTIIRRIQATSFVSRKAGTFSDLSLHEGQAGGAVPKRRLAATDLRGIAPAPPFTPLPHVLGAGPAC